MLPEFKRLFVGNLPTGASESDLKKEFGAYGDVQKVEIKKKENLVDPENPNIFAFVNIEIDPKSLNLCLDEFSKEKYRGHFLNVSVARESFLDRLKREREENSQSNKRQNVPVAKQNYAIEKCVKKPLPKIENQDQSSDDEDSDECESEDSIKEPNAPSGISEGDDEQDSIKEPNAPSRTSEGDDEQTLFITKKRASASLLNGKIKIQSTSNDPIHIITKKQKDVKRLDEKAKKSDQKRKDSQNKMKNQYNQQKLAIQKALAAVDINKHKKFVFDDDEMMNGEETLQNNQKKKDLFNEDDDDEEENNYEKDFQVKTQFLGKSGEKLMKLQSKYKLDPRFKLDERFLENDESYTEINENLPQTEQVDDERSWQLGIIEQVVGRKFETLSEPHKKKLRKTMLRFDPTKEEHQKFHRNIEKVAQTFKVTEKDKQNDKEEIEVSKEQFYTVNDNLTKSLKRRGDGFSLLSLFGKTEEENENQEKKIEKYEEKLLLNKSEKSKLNNPFKFDSSDSEDDTEVVNNDVPKEKQVSEKKQKTDGKTTKSGIKKENFFFFENDERFTEGAAFFNRVKRKEGEEEENYDAVKDRLRLIIKQKIVKSKKNAHKGFRNKNKFKPKT